MRRRKLDPWRNRRPVQHYSPTDLHAMLLDDYTHNRPLGGPMEPGAQWLVLACARIAEARRCTVDEYFQVLKAEGAELTGRTWVPLA